MDTRRELTYIRQRGLGWYQENLGEGVLWYEFDAEHSVFPSVFDEGGRTYAKGIGVPVLWVIENEDDEDNPPEGGRYEPTLRFAVDVAQIRRSGISDVMDAERHQNDIVLFHRTLWTINAYQIRGRMAGHSVIIGVECERVSPDEDFIFDHIPVELVGLLPLMREQAYHTGGARGTDDVQDRDAFTDFIGGQESYPSYLRPPLPNGGDPEPPPGDVGYGVAPYGSGPYGGAPQ
jgi:hypothetical protein